MSEGSNLDTGEGRTTITSTCSEDDAGVLKPQGGTAVDNVTTERTVVSHRNLRENENRDIECEEHEPGKTGYTVL